MVKREQDPSSSKKKQPNTYARYSGIAFQMIIIVIAGVYAGIWLDEKLNLKKPIFTLVLSFLSVILSMYSVIREFLKEK
jgi:ATP synthase protein I